MNKSGKIIENARYIDEGEARAYADDNGLYHINKDGKKVLLTIEKISLLNLFLTIYFFFMI